MTKQLLNEEIGRILEIMGTSQSTINESIGDDVIRKIFSRLGKTLGRNANPVNALRSVFKTATRENFNLLLKNELKIFADTINKAVSKNKSEDDIINKLKTTYGNIFDDTGNFESYLRERIRKKISNPVSNMPFNTVDNLINSSEFQRQVNKFGLSSNQIKATKDLLRKKVNEVGLPKDVNEFNKILKGFMKDVPPKKLKLFEKYKEGLYKEFAIQFGTNVIFGIGGLLLISLIVQLTDCLGEDEEEIIDIGCVSRVAGDRIGAIVLGLLKGVKQGTSKITKKSGVEQSSEESPLYTGDEPGFKEWCKDNNKYRCQYDPQDNSYFDGFLDEYIFDKDKKIWEPKE